MTIKILSKSENGLYWVSPDKNTTLKLDAIYEIKETNALTETYKELRALLFILLRWFVEHKFIEHKELCSYFIADMPILANIAKLKAIFSFMFGFTETSFDRAGNEILIARSIADGKCSLEDLGKFYDDVYQWACDRFDMTDYAKQHKEARKKIGKFY